MTAPWSQEARRRQGIWEIGPVSGKMQTKEKTKSKTCNTFLRLLQKEDRTNLSKPCYISMGKLKKMYIFCTAPTPPPSPTQSETCFSCFPWVLRFSFSCLPSCVSLSYLCLISRVVLLQGLTLSHPQLGLDHDVCFVPQRGKTSKKRNNYILQRKSNFSLPTASSIEINRRLVAIQLY